MNAFYAPAHITTCIWTIIVCNLGSRHTFIQQIATLYLSLEVVYGMHVRARLVFLPAHTRDLDFRFLACTCRSTGGACIYGACACRTLPNAFFITNLPFQMELIFLISACVISSPISMTPWRPRRWKARQWS